MWHRIQNTQRSSHLERLPKKSLVSKSVFPCECLSDPTPPHSGPVLHSSNSLSQFPRTLGHCLAMQTPGFIIAVSQQIHEIHFSSNHPSMTTLIMMF